MLAQNIYFAVGLWFDKLTTNSIRGFTTNGVTKLSPRMELTRSP
jgi:hypothetical protein